MSNRQVILIILAFLALTIGSFIYYIATWDPSERTAGGQITPSAFVLAQKLPPEAPIQ